MLLKSSLDLREDHTFSLLMGGAMKGTWDLKETQLSLKMTELDGYRISEVVAMARQNYASNPTPARKAAVDELSHPLVATLSADRKTLTTKSAAGKAIIVFAKP